MKIGNRKESSCLIMTADKLLGEFYLPGHPNPITPYLNADSEDIYAD
jgi:hypothetical protein